MDWLQSLSIYGSDVGYGIAFLAGILAFFSPCVLPIMPVYVSFFAGVSLEELIHAQPQQRSKYRKAIIKNACLFILGFLVIFMLLGLASGSLGSWLAINKSILQRIGGIFVIILGLYVLEVFKWPWLYKQIKIDFHTQLSRFQWLNSLLAGVTFGFAWTPCVGPVLATILYLATFKGGSLYGVVLLGCFALGLGLPFLVVALGIQTIMPILRNISKYISVIQKIAGSILVILGITLILGIFPYIVGYLLRFSQPIM